jgi:hypothetical protein
MLEITYRSSYTGINVATQTLFEENFIPDFVLSRGRCCGFALMPVANG